MKREEIYNLLVGQVKEVVTELFDESPHITAKTHFADLGTSSCDRAAIVVDTLKMLSMKIPIEEILIASSIGEMVELIYRESTTTTSSAA